MKDFKNKYLKLFIEKQKPNLSPKTILHKSGMISDFLDYLTRNGVTSFNDFDINHIYQYINSLNWRSNTISGLQYCLRDFFNILCKESIVNFDGYKVFPVIYTNKRDRILSFYETKEIREFISFININTRMGIRNKCIILLAAQLGLRSGDISSLKLDDIKWDKNLIEKRQQKTGNTISLPLPNNIKLLLIDYISNHRLNTNIDNVFIDAYGKAVSTENIQTTLRDIALKNNFDFKGRKFGPHALRHSLATRLLNSNTPMPVITNILGHKNLNTTTVYLSIDIKSLRQFSLEVPYDR